MAMKGLMIASRQIKGQRGLVNRAEKVRSKTQSNKRKEGRK